MANPEYQYQRLRKAAEAVNTVTRLTVSASLITLALVGLSRLGEVDSEDVVGLFMTNAGISEPASSSSGPTSSDTMNYQQPEESSGGDSACSNAEKLIESMFGGKYSTDRCEVGSVQDDSSRTESQLSGMCGRMDEFVDSKSDVVTVQTATGEIFQATLHGHRRFTAIKLGGGKRALCDDIILIQP